VQGEEIEMSLRVLRSHGWSITTLAREYGLNWRTVKRAVESEEPRRYLGRAVTIQVPGGMQGAGRFRGQRRSRSASRGRRRKGGAERRTG